VRARGGASQHLGGRRRARVAQAGVWAGVPKLGAAGQGGACEISGWAQGRLGAAQASSARAGHGELKRAFPV
jgi:hypothetical protein